MQIRRMEARKQKLHDDVHDVREYYCSHRCFRKKAVTITEQLLRSNIQNWDLRLLKIKLSVLRRPFCVRCLFG